ncbi:MAG TPA: arylsulfotransferase family protein [Vicinamibacterales bacterium]
MLDVKSFRWPETLFALSCASGLFVYGVAVGRYEVFPYRMLASATDSLSLVVRHRGTLLGSRPTEFLGPSRYPGAGVTTRHADRMAPGVTLLSGFFEGGNEIRLIRSDGSIVNRWPVRFSELFPNTDHVEPKTNVPRSDWNAEIHGALPLRDGSVVFNFNYLGTAKLDRCGAVQWTLPHMTHHVVSPGVNDTLLIPSYRHVVRESRFEELHPPYLDEMILRVSLDGKVLSEISVLDLLYRNNYQGVLFRTHPSGDFIHVNDVEELPAALADRFPMFEPGDLMLSLRSGSVVLVLDPRTERIKWYQAGPWRGQHDPDFLPSGRILIFNNNEDRTLTGSLFGGSNIMEVDPGSGEVKYRYGADPGQRMYTESSGKHQALPGGNVLITEAKVGRVIEVDPNGQIVWEFINRYDDEALALVSEATRYPADYFSVADWSCPRPGPAVARK